MGYFNRLKLWDIARRFGGGQRIGNRANRCLKLAYRAVFDALVKQGMSRYIRKRAMRRLWIQRIDAGARQHGLTYNQFIHALKVENIALDRKVLADLAVNEPFSFQVLVEQMKVRSVQTGVAMPPPMFGSDAAKKKNKMLEAAKGFAATGIQSR